MRFDVLTLFPEMVSGPLSASILGRAQAAGAVRVAVHDIRDHGLGRHRTVDDTPYGGGSGMVMRCDVVAEALRAVEGWESATIVLFEAGGARFDQRVAERLAQQPHLVLVCGHYEGVDARFAEALGDHVERISIGDYVLTGGEYAAMVVVDAVARLLPGVLGNAESSRVESFAARDDGTTRVEFPQYTRPLDWEGRVVPDVLLSGHHAKIEAWRALQADKRTETERPELLVPRGTRETRRS